MNIAGIIPARYASVRLPGKPLILINGKPMIQRVYEQASKSKYLSTVIVATDDERIYGCVKNFGGEVMMTSPKHRSGTDRIAEAAGKIKCSIVVNIQGDEPFIYPENIDAAIEPFIGNRSLNVSTLAIKFKKEKEISDINKVKVIFDKNNYAIYFSRNVIPGYFSKNKKAVYYRHIGLYVYRKSFLMKFPSLGQSYLEKAEKLEQLRILENGGKIKVVLTNKDSYSIDTIRDLKNIIK